MKHESSERLVAYIDVLGFRSMVERDDAKVFQYFETIEHQLDRQMWTSNEFEPEHMIFSDTVVATVKSKDSIDHLSEFLERIKNIQWELARIGILVRGGIAIGKLHFEKAKSRIAGMGLNKAYDLEQLAEYPRIIVDPG